MARNLKMSDARLNLKDRVARWYSFKQKIPIWVILKGLATKDVGICYGHLVYFTTIRDMLWPFGKFSPVLVCCTKEKSGNPTARDYPDSPIRSSFDLI
jgi:hypothetical protein